MFVSQQLALLSFGHDFGPFLFFFFPPERLRNEWAYFRRGWEELLFVLHERRRYLHLCGSN